MLPPSTLAEPQCVASEAADYQQVQVVVEHWDIPASEEQSSWASLGNRHADGPQAMLYEHVKAWIGPNKFNTICEAQLYRL